MRDSDNAEAEERRRLEAERAGRSPLDRMYGTKLVTEAGDEDLRHARRTGRQLQMSFRMHPRVRSIVVAIMRRDRPPSLVVLFELLVVAYLKQHGEFTDGEIPTDDDIIDRFLEQRDARDEE